VNYPRISLHEDALVTLLFWEKLPTPTRELRFAPPRRWRFDFAWPEHKLAVEVEGATWTAGRHTRGAGFAKDAEKLNEAALRGWLVLRVTPEQIDDGRAVEWIKRALAERKAA